MLTADQVVFAASSLGTQRLLHRMKDEGHLPALSDRLGHLARTNSESILGAIAPDTSVDYSTRRGDHLVVPPRRAHPHRAGALRQGQQRDVAAADRAHRRPRPRPALEDLAEGAVARRSWRVLDLYDMKHWSERTVIALVMQSHDNSITTYTKRSRLGRRRVLTSKQGHGEPNPTWIPVANEAVRRMAEILGGTAGGSIGEPFGMPLTAHFIGGCAIGDSAETGVVDGYHRVFGHPGLHIVDGSAISANLGVNPSLTITAQAERAMALWPNQGEADPRPELGSAYQRIDPGRAQAPRRPGLRPRRPPPPHRRRSPEPVWPGPCRTAAVERGRVPC